MGVSIEGTVSSPVVLRYDDLAADPSQVADVGTLVAGRSGTAVPLRDLLDKAGIGSGATWITVESDDASFAASVPLDAVRDAVIVYALDGKPLPREKGGPFRLLIPDSARCGTAEIDKCANVKAVGVLRLEAARGRDVRPSTKAEHIAMHEKPGHGHSH